MFVCGQKGALDVSTSSLDPQDLSNNRECCLQRRGVVQTVYAPRSQHPELSGRPMSRQKKLVRHGRHVLHHPQRIKQATYPFSSTRHTQKHIMILLAAPKWLHPRCHCGPLNSRLPIVPKERNRGMMARLSGNIQKRMLLLKRR